MPDAITAAYVREALAARWPPSENVVVYEAPTGADRQGRKLDALYVSCWRSRGHELDGVEIKVSVSDWRRELKDVEKADWWWQHVHRFWVAAPVAVAAVIRDELPSTWGLLAVAERGVKVLVTPARRMPEPLPWTAVVGLLRTAGGAGLNALARAESIGRDRGYKEGKARSDQEHERQSGDLFIRKQLDDLRSKVEAFKTASGIDVAGRYDQREAERLGQMVAAVQKHHLDTSYLVRQLRETSTRLSETAADLAAVTLEATGG